MEGKSPLEIDMELTTKVLTLARQLHQAMKEWALHLDPTIEYATISGNVFTDKEFHIQRQSNHLPEWATVKNLEALSKSLLNKGHQK